MHTHEIHNNLKTEIEYYNYIIKSNMRNSKTNQYRSHSLEYILFGEVPLLFMCKKKEFCIYSIKIYMFDIKKTSLETVTTIFFSK